MRLAKLTLADAGHRLPHPLNPSIDFPAEGVTVDVENIVWAQLIADGSLIEAPDEIATAKTKR